MRCVRVVVDEKNVSKGDGVKRSIFFFFFFFFGKIRGQRDQTRKPVPKCSSLRLRGGFSDWIAIASSIWRCNISRC